MLHHDSLINKNILIISPESWDHIFVSKHYYTMELAKRGSQVYFLNPPTKRKGISIKKVDGFSNLFIINYNTWVRGQRFLPPFVARIIDRIFFKKIESIAGCKINIVWNFENSRFYDFGFLPKNVLKIYHQVDLNQDFHVRSAAQTADVCFCTTDFIKEKLLPFNKLTFKVPHGFSGSFSPKAVQIFKGAQNIKPEYSRIKAYYIGNLDSFYLDIDIMEQLVQRNQDVDFVFVGPYSKHKSFYIRMSSCKNVAWKGHVNGNSIPDLLDEADILLLIYKAEDFKEQLASPHKVIEYFASGKVIVASYTDEYKDKRHLLSMAEKQDDIITLFGTVKNDILAQNEVKKMRERISYAYENTYSKQLERIECYLSKINKNTGF